MDALKKLAQAGQSVWLDFIERKLIDSGELRRMVNEEGLMGVTSNPAIFEKAVSTGIDYDDFLSKLNAEKKLNSLDLYEALAVRDIQDAADVLLEVYEKTNKRDGYVSLEVSPYLAKDPTGTLEEARRLWHQVNRPNLMIKVPGTPECMLVIQQLISEGINVNVTLLFAKELYAQAAEAYLKGLEFRLEKGLDISAVASVGSFFISRIDSAIDALAPKLSGKVAIANAKLAYQYYRNLVESARFKALEKSGAQSQRLLWASTSTKNPEFRDVLYVEELIGLDTVNTIPPATYQAFKDHGEVLLGRLEENLEAAKQVMTELESLEVNFKEVTDKLLVDGIKLFEKPFDKMLSVIKENYPTSRAS